MKTNFTLIPILFALFLLAVTANAQQTIYSDDFSFQTNWTQSFSGGTVAFSNNVMTLTANTTGTTTVGRKSTLPYTLFVADSVQVQFDFNSSLMGFQAILGTTPSRIQVAKDNGIDLRMSGEANSSTTNDAKFITTTPNVWHTMTIKYKKTATSTTATFIVDDGAGTLTQVVDLTLQVSGYNFILNSIDFRAISGEVLQVRNLKLIGTPASSSSIPLLYSDNFTFKNNWIEQRPLNGSLSFDADPNNTSNNIMKITHIASTLASQDSVTTAMPVFNFTGTNFIINYKFRTKGNRTSIAFGTSPKRLYINNEYTDAIPTKMRLCGEANTLAYGAKTFLSATFNVWHSMSLNYTIADRTALLTVDPNLPSGTTITVDLKTQPTPYDLILNAMTLKAAYADVFEIKDLQIYGVGTASASTPNSLTAVNEVLQNNMLKDVRVVKGVMSFTIDNANSTSSKLYLHNVLGSKVLEQNINPGLSTCSIPVSGIASGVYLLTFESAGNHCSQKLIIQ
ncbi:MAG: T9SS type A sorting domain-containing protein [Paludibacter sp.]